MTYNIYQNTDHARRVAYELLARLYLEEVDSTMLEYLREIPGLAEHVPIPDIDVNNWLTDLKTEAHH